MKVEIFVSERETGLPHYVLLRIGSPLSLLPAGEKWTHVRSGDTSEFHLPEAVEQEIQERGRWAHTFGEGATVSGSTWKAAFR